MKKILFIFSLFPIFLFSQIMPDISVEKAAIDIPGTSYRWGNDIVVLDAEPIGGFYGVQKSNGTMYVAINDISATPNLGIIVMFSTNKGDTWQMHPSGITIREKVDNIKLIRSGLDSIYCFFQYNTDVYCWNIERSFVNQVLLGNYRTFDAVATSSGNIFVFVDSLPNSSLLRYGSTDGGSTWISRGNITGTGGFPKVTMSTSGDTVLLNYRGPVLADTATSAIRNVRYRETTPGVMAVTGSFTDIVPAGEEKHEYRSAFRNGEILFMYTKGAVGNRDIFFRKSMDYGVSFSAEEPAVNSPTRDEYWFDMKSYFEGAGGFDIIYYSDSTSAVPTIFTDRLLFTGNQYGSLSIPMPGTLVNEFPLEWSDREYPPQIIEMHYSNNDCGVMYVGNTGTGKKLMWDYLTNIIPVELTSFTAVITDGNIILNWTTATETNNFGFEVERINNAHGNWHTVGFVDGNGTTTENVNYNFTDENVPPGSYSYRLKQIDYNGVYEYSTIINIDVIKAGEFALLQNYPNPFNPVTKINFQIPDNAAGVTTLKIYDVVGNEVAVLVNENKPSGLYEVIFDASELSSGMYFYELRNADFTSVKKMILIK